MIKAGPGHVGSAQGDAKDLKGLLKDSLSCKPIAKIIKKVRLWAGLHPGSRILPTPHVGQEIDEGGADEVHLSKEVAQQQEHRSTAEEHPKKVRRLAMEGSAFQ